MEHRTLLRPTGKQETATCSLLRKSESEAHHKRLVTAVFGSQKRQAGAIENLMQIEETLTPLRWDDRATTSPGQNGFRTKQLRDAGLFFAEVDAVILRSREMLYAGNQSSFLNLSRHSVRFDPEVQGFVSLPYFCQLPICL